MTNVVWHRIDKNTDRKRQAAKGWLSGSVRQAKITITSLVERAIDSGKTAYLLDGDNVRRFVFDLAFSERDRVENIRRLAEVAALFEDSGVIAIVNAITPWKR